MAANIGQFLNDAINKINMGELEMASASLCIAISGTASKAFPNVHGDAKKYKEFLKQHMSLIAFVATGLALKNGSSIRLKFDHQRVQKDSEGYCQLEDILYHIIRCGLIHEAIFPSEITLGDRLSGNGELPIGILNGLIIAVIVTPENLNERLPQEWSQSISGKEVKLNDFWGKEQDLVEYLGLQWLVNKI